jgi:hypothetical protein
MHVRPARLVASLLGLSVALSSGGTAAATGALQARNDTYRGQAEETLKIGRGRGIFGNDTGQPLTLLTHTDPAHGTLEVNTDGAFTYTPADGFVGTESDNRAPRRASPCYRAVAGRSPDRGGRHLCPGGIFARAATISAVASWRRPRT